jgi:ABC-2 type transport system ATP-binding protein
MGNAIECEALTRTFGGNKKKEPIVALDDIELEVKEGELFGLLGPNGAGKTTLIKILATLLLPTSGRVSVLGYDVEKDAQKIRPCINMVSGGEVSGYGLLTVKENLWMFSQFYGIPSEVAKRKIRDLLETFSLSDKANAKVRTISTGQRQRMNVVRGFVTDPELIFLDEPTLGLDVNSSRVIREYIRNWVKNRKGKTVLLTTHYMMEADELCDRVAVIDRGRILACDSPQNLKRRARKAATFTIETTPIERIDLLKKIAGVQGLTTEAVEDRIVIRVVVDEESIISDLVSQIISAGAKILSLAKSEPTLEDVFIQLVGRGLV